MGGKTREKFFSKNTRISRAINDGKKIVWKKSEKMFFNKHMNIETINGGKKARKFFSKSTRISREKKMEKNRLEKVRKHAFYENTNIVTKKWGK